MFATTLHANELDQQRLQRLMLAAAIAVSTTAIAVASVWTLERLGVHRVTGPNQQYEVAQFSLLPPPPAIQPPPPPPPNVETISTPVTNGGAAVIDDLIEPDGNEEPDRVSPFRADRTGPVGPLVGLACPPGQRCDGTNPLISKPCVGPLCIGTSKQLPPITATIDSAPAEVDFSSLRCLACADPDKATLRKTIGNNPTQRGKVVARFCVDSRGRVESSSIDVVTSFGVKAVDQVVTRTISTWRFSPLAVDGKPRRACSEARFVIRFD